MRKQTEDLLKATKDLDFGRYSLGCTDCIELVKEFENEPIELVFAAFNIGFLKGRRSEKARQKKTICNRISST